MPTRKHTHPKQGRQREKKRVRVRERKKERERVTRKMQGGGVIYGAHTHTARERIKGVRARKRGRESKTPVKLSRD